jgi:hypothetical protein
MLGRCKIVSLHGIELAPTGIAVSNGSVTSKHDKLGTTKPRVNLWKIDRDEPAACRQGVYLLPTHKCLDWCTGFGRHYC